MSDKRYVVPDGMLKAALDAKEMPHLAPYENTVRPALEAALRWLAVNPVVPTQAQANALVAEYRGQPPYGCSVQYAIAEWMKRMFLAPEPEVPEAVKDLLCAGADTVKEAYFRPDIYNERIIEAYRRGKGAK